MATKELVLELSEVQHVSVICPSCKMQMMFDVSKTELPQHLCLGRNTAIGGQLMQALDALRKAHHTLITGGQQGYQARVHVQFAAEPSTGIR